MAIQFDSAGVVQLGTNFSAVGAFTLNVPTFEYRAATKWVIGHDNSGAWGIITLSGGQIKTRLGSGALDVDVFIPDIQDGDFVEGMVVTRDASNLVTVTIGSASNTKTVSGTITFSQLGYGEGSEQTRYDGIMYGELSWDYGASKLVHYDLNATSGTVVKDLLDDANDSPLVGFNAGGFVSNPSDGNVDVDASFSVNAPTFSAIADVTLPQPSASIAYSVNAPTFTADAAVTLPNPTADVSYTVGAPAFSVSATTIETGAKSDLLFSVIQPLFSANAAVTLPDAAAECNISIPTPSFSISCSVPAPRLQPRKTISVTGGRGRVISAGSRATKIIRVN